MHMNVWGEVNFKNVGIWEADTIRQVEMKERIKKSLSEEREHLLKPISSAETSSKG